MLRVHLFGAGRLFDDSEEIQLPSRTWTLPLLAYLVFHRGEMLPRQRVAFALWPDDPEEIALRNLRRNLYRLIQALPRDKDPPWIVVPGHNISWNTSSAFVLDVAEFERLRTDPSTLEEAVAVYSGDLLEELHDDWIAAERERLGQSYRGDLRALAVAYRSRRAFPAATRYAQRLLDADPWHEDALRQLMSVRYESGDAAGAIAAFDVFAKRLREEMRVEPMVETVALRDAIARGAPILGTVMLTEPHLKSGPALTPFVGRADDLGRLRSQWLRAAAGRGGIGFVRGEAGIGKSRLVWELALITEAEGGRIIAGSTSSPERDSYQCLSSAIRRALPLVAGVAIAPPLLAAVADLVPELRSHRPDVPQLVRVDPINERARLIDAMAQLIGALAKPRPLLVILEDLHRAGVATIEAIGEIVPRLARSPVLVLATYRQEDVGRNHPLRTLERTLHPPAERITVGPLGRSDVAMLVDAIAPNASAEFIVALTERSQGNPLFATELARDASLATPASFAMPPSVRELIMERVASLAPETRTVAEVAAVVGESFTVDTIGEIAGLAEGELLDRIDDLLDRHLIRESTERGRYEYAFTHHLVHAAIYETMPGTSRTRRHRRLARILDAAGLGAYDERAAEIALHYERGGDGRRAATHYAAASQRAAQLYANAEARDFITRALKLGKWDARERFDLLMLRCHMNARLADAHAEQADLIEMEALAGKVDADASCAALAQRIGMARRYGDHVAEAETIERLEAYAGRAGSERWLAAAAEARAGRDLRLGDHPRALANALQARDIYKTLGDDRARARATSLAARISSLVPDGAKSAQQLADDALRLAHRCGDAETLLETLGNAGVVAQERQDYAAMADFNRVALELCLQVGSRAAEIRRRDGLGTALWGLWRIDEALAEYREALRLSESLGIVQVAPLLCNMGGILMEVGDYAGAVEWQERALKNALEAQLTLVAPTAAINLAEASWQSGRLDAFREALQRAAPYVERAPESRFEAHFLLNRGRLLRAERAFEQSAVSIERAVDLYERTGRWSDAADALDDLALTHLESGEISPATDALDRRMALVTGHAYRSIRHDWTEARVHRAAGRLEASRRALRRAHDFFAELLAALGDNTTRASFEAVPVHAALRAAFDRDQWPAGDGLETPAT